MNYLALALAGLVLTAQAAVADSSATYTVTFDGTWSSATHPTEYPTGAHFSGLIGATHDARYVLFGAGRTATDGLERLAEKGAHSPLDEEIRTAIASGVAGALFEGQPIHNPPGQASVTFTIDEKHPLVSLVAMIAPSPDWFTGVAEVDLRENGQWAARRELTLYAWDAGTDGGTTYQAADDDTQPRDAIAENRSPHFIKDGERIAVGKLVFEKAADAPMQTSHR